LLFSQTHQHLKNVTQVSHPNIIEMPLMSQAKSPASGWTGLLLCIGIAEN
jgi:hypothetical protein